MKPATACAADATASRVCMNIYVYDDLRSDIARLIVDSAQQAAHAFGALAYYASVGDFDGAERMFGPARQQGICIRDAFKELAALDFHGLGHLTSVEGQA